MAAKGQIVSAEYQAQVEAYQALTGKFQSLLADQQQLESQLHENTMVFDVRFSALIFDIAMLIHHIWITHSLKFSSLRRN